MKTITGWANSIFLGVIAAGVVVITAVQLQDYFVREDYRRHLENELIRSSFPGPDSDAMAGKRARWAARGLNFRPSGFDVREPLSPSPRVELKPGEAPPELPGGKP